MSAIEQAIVKHAEHVLGRIFVPAVAKDMAQQIAAAAEPDVIAAVGMLLQSAGAGAVNGKHKGRRATVTPTAPPPPPEPPLADGVAAAPDAQGTGP